MKKDKVILIIEDDSFLRKAISDKLIKTGYVIHEAKDGVEGLAAAKKYKPDLIILDLMMPKMDGLSMLEYVKKDQEVSEIPIIVLTNLSDSKSEMDVLEAGVHDYLVKTDWTLEQLIEKIESKIN